MESIRTEYIGEVEVFKRGTPIASDLLNVKFRMGQVGVARITHWRSIRGGREMYLLKFPGRVIRYLDGERANFTIEDGVRVILSRPTTGFEVAKYGFLLPPSLGPAAYRSRPPDVRLDTAVCGDQPDCKEIVILVSPDNPLGVMLRDHGHWVQGPQMGPDSLRDNDFRFSGDKQGYPTLVTYREFHAAGPSVATTWRLASGPSHEDVSFDPKQYLTKGYDLGVRVGTTSIYPRITVDHPDPFAVFAAEERKTDQVTAETKSAASDSGQMIGLSMVGAGLAIVLVAAGRRRWQRMSHAQ